MIISPLGYEVHPSNTPPRFNRNKDIDKTPQNKKKNSFVNFIELIESISLFNLHILNT